MSSETSTEQAPSRADSPNDPLSQACSPGSSSFSAALGCATAVTFLARGQGVTAVLLLAVLMAATALVGLAALRAIAARVAGKTTARAMIGQRTRAALEREKTLALRTIKELEFDRAMGKMSDEDFREMSGRLRARASRLIRQLDAGSGYRAQIERDLGKAARRMRQTSASPRRRGVCATCSTCERPGRALLQELRAERLLTRGQRSTTRRGGRGGLGTR